MPSVVVVELHDEPKPHFAGMWHYFVMILTRNRVSISLSLAGASASPVPVAMDAIDPWHTPVTPIVETVEPCSRSLLVQQTWCVQATFW